MATLQRAVLSNNYLSYMKQNIWDVFISHACEDKAEVARPLANMLAEAGLKVWLDEAELNLGDSLREKIEEGLAKSQFGVVILSHNFFNKQWAKSELNGLFSKDLQEGKVLLPVWHNIEQSEILNYSPMLSDKFAASTKKGLFFTRDQIVNTIRRYGKNQRIEQPLYSGRITKKMLFEFPAGSILMSNSINPLDNCPFYVEELQRPEDREKLWEKIKEFDAKNSLHYVFIDANGYRAHLNSMDIYNPIHRDKRWR